MAEKKWTIREILEWTTAAFRERSFASPLLDAQLLLGAALSLPKISLYTQMEKPLSNAERESVRAFVKRRLAGEPVAYILNRKAWHDLDLFVDGRVLIPRPETESVLDVTFAFVRARGPSPKVIYDLCTGSGCLAIAMKKRYPDAEVIGVDVSESALEVAKLNAERNETPDVQFLLADLERPPTYDYLRRVFGPAQIIVANPPYVAEREWTGLDVSVRAFEPRLALVAADDGHAIARTIVRNVLRSSLLDGQAGAVLIMEQGVDHPRRTATQIAEHERVTDVPPRATGRIFSVNDSPLQFPVNDFFTVRDLAGKERFLGLLWNEQGAFTPRPEVHHAEIETVTTEENAPV